MYFGRNIQIVGGMLRLRRDMAGKKMIRVLMCGNHPSNKGGMTSVISQIRSYDWKKKSIKMKFIPTFYPGNTIIKSLYFMLSYIRIFIVMLFWKPDIVHMHMSYKGSFHRKFLIHKLCRLFGVKDIIHLHGSEFEKWYVEVNGKTKEKIRLLLKESGVFFVLGEYWKNVVETIEPSVNAVILHNAVPIPEDMVKWDNDRCQVLYMGVLIPRKGVDILLKAFSRLKQQGKLGKLRLAIAGTGSEEAALKTYCHENGLKDIVSFYGWKSGKEKAEMIRTSQIAVMPSYNEGLPIAVLEEISYGMPVVATDVGDMASAVRDGVNGYLISPGQEEALAEKLAKTAEKECFSRMSQASRKLAEREYSQDIFFDKILDNYIKLSRVNS